MKKFTAFLVMLTCFGLTDCYYDKFDELHPLDGYTNSCDQNLAATYTASVNLIIRSNCVSCHSANVHSGDIYLETYSQVKAVAASGKLMGSILHQSGFVAMPPGVSIRSCEIQRLQDWVNAGMPENNP